MSPPLVGGIDEVGTGAWAGFYLTAVTVFRNSDLALLPSGVTDSKRVSEKGREALYLPIISAALDVGFGHAWPWEIDDLGPTPALQLAYRRALAELKHYPDLLIVDGSHRVEGWKGKQLVQPKADLNHIQVSAASILAKVARDRSMVEIHQKHPAYGWDENKGYGSAKHEAAIHQHGLILGAKTLFTYIHRRRYCQKVLLRGNTNAA